MALDLEDLSRAFRDKLQLPMVLVPSSVAPRPSTCLLLKRREVAEVERALQRQQEEFWQRMERLAQSRQQLDQREQRLQDVVLKFTAFLKASAARQERALQRTAEAQAQAAEQDAKAAHLHHQLAGLQRRRDRLAQHLRSLQCFHSYLQDVLARMGQFQDVPSMLAHFEALLALRAALAQEAEAGQERLARGWAQLRGYREETLSELLCIATEEAQHHMCLEAAHREVLQGESCWAHAQSTATEKTLVLAQIKLAVLNLFHLATVPLKIHTDVALEDTEAQLDTVLLCMQDLAAICAELRPRQPGPCPAVTSVASQGYQGATEP
ncbi:cilia- and flagella-associated protein 73 isoform X2 [Melopsittacus undulatus]|uniref:cilia- and flagella-associated protein 73 isoform X2 n=1 Tax=Melopsittacus undulatus TaxID=13146 RepID=UPI00146E3468|nr:cilia- and flagella-associated protein 73 isoform X2 [Melopsittacus undulatus]